MRNYFLFLLIVIGGSSIRASDSTKRVAAFDEKLFMEYRTRRTSNLKICKTGPYSYVRFKKVKDLEGQNPDRIITKISNSAKSAANFTEEDEYNNLHVSTAQDINGDGLKDLLIFTGDCGSDGDCLYSIFAHCGMGQYKKVSSEHFSANRDLKISSKTTVVDGAPWNTILSGTRYRDLNLGCDAAIGDFWFQVAYDFNGKAYSMSKDEDRRVKKLIQSEIRKINDTCGRNPEK